MHPTPSQNARRDIFLTRQPNTNSRGLQNSKASTKTVPVATNQTKIAGSISQPSQAEEKEKRRTSQRKQIKKDHTECLNQQMYLISQTSDLSQNLLKGSNTKAVQLSNRVVRSNKNQILNHYRHMCQEQHLGNYQVLQKIGIGGFGIVYLARHKITSELVALKMISKREVCRQGLAYRPVMERDILEKLQHPFIIQLKASFQTVTHIVMVLTLAFGGDIAKLLKNIQTSNFHSGKSINMHDQNLDSSVAENKTKREKKHGLPENWVRFYLAELCLALDYLHGMNIVFRDLKAENVMLNSDGHILLVDFGLSEDISSESRTEGLCGTAHYISPELIKQQEWNVGVDWWAFGILAFELLTGVLPFDGENNDEIFDNILKGDIHFPHNMAPTTRDFISHLLCQDPEQRLGSPNQMSPKDHPFFHDIDWNALFLKKVKPPHQPDLLQAPEAPQLDPRDVLDLLSIIQTEKRSLVRMKSKDLQEEMLTTEDGADTDLHESEQKHASESITLAEIQLLSSSGAQMRLSCGNVRCTNDCIELSAAFHDYIEPEVIHVVHFVKPKVLRLLGINPSNINDSFLAMEKLPSNWSTKSTTSSKKQNFDALTKIIHDERINDNTSETSVNSSKSMTNNINSQDFNPSNWLITAQYHGKQDKHRTRLTQLF